MNTDHWKSLIWNCRIHGRSQSWHSSSLSFEMSHWNYSYCCSCTTHPSMTCSCCPGCWFHNWRHCEAWLDQDVKKMCALGQGRSDKLEPIAAISEAWWKWNIDANESNESLCLVYATSKFLKVFLCCQNLCSQRNQIQKCHETQHNPGDTNPSLRGLLLSQFFVQIPDRPERSHLDQSSMVIPLDPIDPYWTFESPASPTSPMGFQEKITPRPCSNLSAFWIELAGKRQTSSKTYCIYVNIRKNMKKHNMERYCKCGRQLWRYLTPLQELKLMFLAFAGLYQALSRSPPWVQHIWHCCISAYMTHNLQKSIVSHPRIKSLSIHWLYASALGLIETELILFTKIICPVGISKTRLPRFLMSSSVISAVWCSRSTRYSSTSKVKLKLKPDLKDLLSTLPAEMYCLGGKPKRQVVLFGPPQTSKRLWILKKKMITGLKGMLAKEEL